MNPPSTRNPPTSLAAFRLRNQQQQSSHVGDSQTLGSGHSGAEPACTEPAHSGRFTGAHHGRARHHPRGPCRVSQSRRDNAHSLAWAGSSRTPAVANAASGPAPCNWTPAAATVVGIKFNGASVSRNNRPSASHQFSATTSLFRIRFLTILLLNSSTAPSLPKPSDFLLPQPRGMAASPLTAGHRRCTATRLRPADLPRVFELKYNEMKSSSGTGSSQRGRRRAVCQPHLQVQRISVQFSQGAQRCSKTSPSWLLLPPAPLLSKRKIQHGGGRGGWRRREGGMRGRRGRDLPVGLAAHGSHFHSHPNDGPSG